MESIKANAVDDFFDLIDKILAWIFLPATYLGAAGGVACAVREKRVTWKKIVFKLTGGLVTAHLATPVVLKYVSPEFYGIAMFLAGFGGLELVNRVYDFFSAFLESSLRHRANILNPRNDDKPDSKGQ